MSKYSEHAAGTDWDCLACGKPWPCDPARERLVLEGGDLATLSILMWTYFDDYVREAGPGLLVQAHGQFLEPYERFLGWLHAAHIEDPS